MLKTPSDFSGLLAFASPPDSLPPTDLLPFIFRGGQIMVEVHSHGLPHLSPTLHAQLITRELHPVGLWQGRLCCATWVEADFPAPEGFHFVHMRTLFEHASDSLLGIAGRAAQIAEWARTHRFCGACGTPMQLAPTERAFKCPACGMTAYPRISPAMMVLIRRGHEVLLARHTQSPTGRFSPLAGFLEAGETIEEAVHREVFEEVGLTVSNVQYFGSQSWPFPHSLMIAFTADYAGGEIRVDDTEIAEARWFDTAEPLEKAYPTVSISGLLVNAHLRARNPAH